MKLTNLLNGFILGEKQEVGVMAVIPLIEKEKTVSPVAPLTDLQFLGTYTYGDMKFVNKNEEKPVIIPAGYMALTKQAAQDHALPTSHILPVANGIQSVDFACCVEQTQGGYIQPEQNFEFQLLPINVRKQHAKGVISMGSRVPLENFSDFGRLWDNISKFQNKMIKDDLAHIVWFFNKFVSKLDEFNAEFESVKGQRGAIVLINNEVIGIEIAPSTEDWAILWKRLIRETYGSEVVRLSYEDLSGTFVKKEEQKLNLDSVTSISELREAIAAKSSLENEQVVEQLLNLLEGSTALKSRIKEVGGVTYEASAVGSDKLIEVYSKDDKVVYASIVL